MIKTYGFCVALVLAACSSSSSGTTTSTPSAGAAGMMNGGAGASNAGAANGGSAGAAGAHSGGSAGLAGTGGASGAAGSAGSGGAAGAGTVGNCTPPTDIYSPIEKLSLTGCVDPTDPRKPIASAVSYEVNSPLWSDSADKERAFILPAGQKIHVRDCVATPSDCPAGIADNGRWDFPIGTVMVKIFEFDDKLVETRLLMRQQSGDWIGYNYQWNEAQTEATIVDGDRAEAMFNTGTRTVDWHYPSRKDCLDCHTAQSGSTLGPETAQMNRVVGGTNQIDKFTTLGLFETPPPKPYKAALVTPYPGQMGSPAAGATTEQEARSYLHANCAFCHRPDGLFPNFDFRYDTAFKDMKICNAMAMQGTVGTSTSTTILSPGHAMDSVMWQRMNQADPDNGRMPQIGSYAIDTNAVTLVGNWINAITSCP